MEQSRCADELAKFSGCHLRMNVENGRSVYFAEYLYFDLGTHIIIAASKYIT